MLLRRRRTEPLSAHWYRLSCSFQPSQISYQQIIVVEEYCITQNERGEGGEGRGKDRGGEVSVIPGGEWVRFSQTFRRLLDGDQLLLLLLLLILPAVVGRSFVFIEFG